MARLIPFSLQIGQRLVIRDKRYVVTQMGLASRAAVLSREGGGDERVEVSRNELAALLVNEQARFFDELEEPEAERAQLRTVTDITHLSVARMMEWQSKIYLLKALAHLVGHSPRSKAFTSAMEEALGNLQIWHEALGLGGQSTWSPWTLYHDLLRWRANAYDIAALQRKGVEYCPWSQKNELYDVVREIAAYQLKQHPSISAAGLHRKINQELANGEYKS